MKTVVFFSVLAFVYLIPREAASDVKLIKVEELSCSEMFEMSDHNCDGVLSFEEAEIADEVGFFPGLKDEFYYIDLDGSGYLNTQEIQEICNIDN